MAACFVVGILKKYLIADCGNSSRIQHIYNAVTSAVTVAVILIVADISSLSCFTALLGAGFGCLVALQQITTLRALELGSFSYTTVITSLSTLIPALSGVLFWNESIHWIQIIGIVLMVACFILSVDLSSEKKKATTRWILYCAAAFLCTGFIGIFQKWHQNTAYKGELDGFLVIAFAVSAAISGVSLLLLKGKKESAVPMGWKAVVMVLISGVCLAINNKLNLYLSGVIDSAVFFPIVNGGNLILTSSAAFILFKEKLTRLQWVGLILGIVAVILLSNPFA